MASSSGTSSGSTSLLQNSGSDEDLQQVMDQRKRKRMLSNRESARRSRMRKQKHLDELMAQVAQLRKENNEILTSLNITSRHYVNIESDNSILRAQMGELNNRLQSLTEISQYLNANNNMAVFETEDLNPHYNHHHQMMISTHNDNTFMNPWNLPYLNQPIMASADMFQY